MVRCNIFRISGGISMYDVVAVSFVETKNIYYFSPNHLDIKKGDKVIVDTENGLQFGIVKQDIKLSFMLHTPILLLTFNRPDHTRQVLTEILKQEPHALYVFQDGARPGNENDKIKCQEVRDVINELTAPYAVEHKEFSLHTLYQKQNLGCGPGPAAGISWFFEQEEMGLIFEDDAVPHPDFFEYAATLLERYKDDESVRAIGSMKLYDKTFGDGSYYFSMMNRTLCAWASWRRAWKYFDYRMMSYTREDLNKSMKLYGATLREREYWMNRLDEIHRDCLGGSSWDQQFWMTIWLTGGKGICPNSNLSTNIGFDAEGTHTRNADSIGACRPLEPILPLCEPKETKIQRKADLLFHKTYFEPWQYGWSGIKRLPNRIMKRIERLLL